MKSLSKPVALLVAGITVLAIAAIGLSPVFADSPGQIVGGPNVYVVKDVTTSGSYSSSISPACSDVIQYSAELHNPMNGGLTNVKVSANLGNGSFSAVPAEGANYGTTASVNVSLPSGGSLTYQGGTTTLYDGNGNVIQALPDGITNGGINIGNLPGSTTEFVNFRAQVGCTVPAPSPTVFTATATATASASASATASCPADQGGGSATTSASGSATATATATSSISQAAAYQLAYNNALQQANSPALANAEANAKAKATASVKCSSAQVTHVTPGPVSQTLPNTGPGDVLGIFTGTSALGGVGHYLVTRRRRK